MARKAHSNPLSNLDWRYLVGVPAAAGVAYYLYKTFTQTASAAPVEGSAPPAGLPVIDSIPETPAQTFEASPVSTPAVDEAEVVATTTSDEPVVESSAGSGAAAASGAEGASGAGGAASSATGGGIKVQPRASNVQIRTSGQTVVSAGKYISAFTQLPQIPSGLTETAKNKLILEWNNIPAYDRPKGLLGMIWPASLSSIKPSQFVVVIEPKNNKKALAHFYRFVDGRPAQTNDTTHAFTISFDPSKKIQYASSGGQSSGGSTGGGGGQVQISTRFGSPFGRRNPTQDMVDSTSTQTISDINPNVIEIKAGKNITPDALRFYWLYFVKSNISVTASHISICSPLFVTMNFPKYDERLKA